MRGWGRWSQVSEHTAPSELSGVHTPRALCSPHGSSSSASTDGGQTMAAWPAHVAHTGQGNWVQAPQQPNRSEAACGLPGQRRMSVPAAAWQQRGHAQWCAWPLQRRNVGTCMQPLQLPAAGRRARTAAPLRQCPTTGMQGAGARTLQRRQRQPCCAPSVALAARRPEPRWADQSRRGEVRRGGRQCAARTRAATGAGGRRRGRRGRKRKEDKWCPSERAAREPQQW